MKNLFKNVLEIYNIDEVTKNFDEDILISSIYNDCVNIFNKNKGNNYIYEINAENIITTTRRDILNKYAKNNICNTSTYD